MINNDIITDITEITKNNKGLQQTAISQYNVESEPWTNAKKFN